MTPFGYAHVGGFITALCVSAYIVVRTINCKSPENDIVAKIAENKLFFKYFYISTKNIWNLWLWKLVK